jgi:hypothetical protein
MKGISIPFAISLLLTTQDKKLFLVLFFYFFLFHSKFSIWIEKTNSFHSIEISSMSTGCGATHTGGAHTVSSQRTAWSL